MPHLIKLEEKANSVSLDTLREGEFAVVVSDSQAFGHIVLKTGNSAVSLATGEFIDVTWATRVRKLLPGSKFTIEVTALINLSLSQIEAVKNLLHRGEKIQAIKYVRDITHAGLKEAKDYVDAVV